MTKHILQDVTDHSGAPIEAKAQSNVFMVNPQVIKVVPGLNPRTDFGNIEELKISIKNVGVRVPMKVKKNSNKELELVNGGRRLRSVMELLSEGVEIKSVPVVVLSSKTSEIDAYVDTIVENTGKPLNPAEEATAYKKLKAWGLTIKEIAGKCVTSETTVRNRLELADGAPVVKKAVAAGEITNKQAIDIIKTSSGRVDAQTEKVEEIQTAPRPSRQKITRIFVDKGEVKSKSGTCEPLQAILSGQHLRASIIAAGYNPDSIKLSIVKIVE